MPVDELGYGEVWSDLEKPILHFGSPAVKPQPSKILDRFGKPIVR